MTEHGGSKDGRHKGLLLRRRRWWSEHLGRNAFRHLDQATAESGHALPISWVLRDDRDLKALRETDEWEFDTRGLEAKHRQRHTRGDERTKSSHTTRDSPRDQVGTPVKDWQTPPSLVSPRRPWPKPILRIAFWALLGVAAAICCLFFTSESVWWIAALCVVLLFATWQIVQGLRERKWRRQLKREVADKVVSRSSRRP
jgi:hypothetical protein